MVLLFCVQVVAYLSDVGSGHTEAVLSVLRARQEEIHKVLLNRTHSISFAALQDFDWQLKVTPSSLLSFGVAVVSANVFRLHVFASTWMLKSSSLITSIYDDHQN